MRWALFIVVILVAAMLMVGYASVFSASSALNFRFAQTQFEITVTGGQLAATDREVQTYVERASNAVTTYFGRMPMKHVNIEVRVVGGDRVRFGRSSPYRGGTLTMFIGGDTNADTLNRDWTLTHEMTHLAFPATREDNRDWIAEGMATYIEPIARAQCGYLTNEYIWREFANNMQKGEPEPGDRGMDNTPTWGRTYWGGAMFWLVADVQIRRQTHNRKGVEDAFRTIMSEDGTMEDEWPTEMIFETGDRATGTHVLEDLYRDWKDKPVQVDLAKMWTELGIEKKGDTVVFHDDAPYSSIRKAITSRR